MLQRSYLCQVTTPMFVSGALQNEAELRPPAIKALLRFWWRACHAHLALPKLRREEAKLFGRSAEKEDAARVRSPFNVFVGACNHDRTEAGIFKRAVGSGQETVQRMNLFEAYELHHAQSRGTRGKDRGTNYLFYPLKMGDNKHRPHIKPGTRFEVTFSSCDPTILEIVGSTFLLSSVCGALGSRARRGLGNFRILNEGFDFPSIDSFKDWIEKIPLSPSHHNSYSHLSGARIMLSNDGYATTEEALKQIGNRFCDFRGRCRSDKHGASIFGLPLRGAFRGIKHQGREIQRRASPLIIKTQEVNQRQHWMLISLAGKYFPEDTAYGQSRVKAPPPPGKT